MAERFTFTWKTSPEGLPEPEFDREEKWFRYVSIVNFPFWSGESMGKLPQSPSMISMDLFILIPGLILGPGGSFQGQSVSPERSCFPRDAF